MGSSGQSGRGTGNYHRVRSSVLLVVASQPFFPATTTNYRQVFLFCYYQKGKTDTVQHTRRSTSTLLNPSLVTRRPSRKAYPACDPYPDLRRSSSLVIATLCTLRQFLFQPQLSSLLTQPPTTVARAAPHSLDESETCLRLYDLEYTQWPRPGFFSASKIIKRTTMDHIRDSVGRLGGMRRIHV